MLYNEAQPVITRSCMCCGKEIRVSDRDWDRVKGRLVHVTCIAQSFHKDENAPLDK